MGRGETYQGGKWVPRETGEQGAEPVDVEMRKDGTIRRPGAGGRKVSDFFSDDNLRKPITRADYVNLRSSEEYSRREQRLLRRALRWLRGMPQAKDMNAAMSAAHSLSIEGVFTSMKQQMDAAEDERGRVAMTDIEAKK